jgi:hypothetical protein
MVTNALGYTPLSGLGFSYGTGVNANHVVQRDSSGYIYANYINFSTGESENPTISSFLVSNGDGWSRKASLAHVRSQLGNYGGWITGINSSMVTSALGYTPYNSSNPNGYITSSGSITGNAATASLATFISSQDGDRVAGNRLPTSSPRAVRFDFVTAGSVTGATGNYAGVMTYAPWDGTVSTGDSSYQLAFVNESGVDASSNPGLKLRNGINSTWNSWLSIITSSNIAAQSVNYATNAGNAETVDGLSLWTGTQAAYDAIATKSSTTIYFIE